MYRAGTSFSILFFSFLFLDWGKQAPFVGNAQILNWVSAPAAPGYSSILAFCLALAPPSVQYRLGYIFHIYSVRGGHCLTRCFGVNMADSEKGAGLENVQGQAPFRVQYIAIVQSLFC